MSDNMRRRAMMSGLPPMRSQSSSTTNGSMKRRDYTPVSWDKYFERKHDVVLDKDTFCVYESGSAGPVIFFLHGGGFSGLSWAILTKMLTGMLPCRCAAMDARGHGCTVTTDDTLLAADMQASDVGRVVQKLYADEAPPIILVGHSMGGAIAIHCIVKEMIPTVAGLIVIDVVEGTALDALASMQSFLRGRPTVFKSVEHAIEYCVRTGQIRNVDSARVSVIGQIKKISEGKQSTSVSNGASATAVYASSNIKSHRGIETLTEDDEADDKAMPDDRAGQNGSHLNGFTHDDDSKQSNGISHSHKMADSHESGLSDKNVNSEAYGWRIDLTKTEKYWQGWFQGMSKMFLSCGVPKMLLLAGIDRLDKELTVGQMQGKFQMQVLPKCGHAVHEDSPDKVADVLASFLVRNRLVESKENVQRELPA